MHTHSGIARTSMQSCFHPGARPAGDYNACGHVPAVMLRQAGLRIESEMQAANISAVLLAILLWAAPSFAFTAAAAAAVGAGRAAILGERLEAALPYVRAQAGDGR